MYVLMIDMTVSNEPPKSKVVGSNTSNLRLLNSIISTDPMPTITKYGSELSTA